MKKYSIFEIIVISIIGCALYVNSLQNSFFADDFHQIIDNPKVTSMRNIPGFFSGSTFYTGSTELSGNYYKPLLSTVFTFEYLIFNHNSTGYHLFQLILHISNAVFIFFIVKMILKKEIAFLISLFFLIHPINTETVVYIANTQDTLFLFFGLLAMIMLNSASRISPFLITLLLVLSLLSKETGIVFLFILPLFSYLWQKGNLKKILVCVTIAGILYILLRFFVAGIYFNNLTTAPIMQYNFIDRLIHIPYILFFYLKTFFFPKDLIIFQTDVIKELTFQNFFLPLIGISLFGVSMYIIIKKLIQNKYKKEFTFFTLWLLIGLIPHLQLIPLDGTVADRWFYFSSVGAIGQVAVIVISLSEHYPKFQKIWLPLLLIVFILFCTRVVIRNQNWKDQKTLLAHDLNINPKSYQLNEGLGLELMKENKFDEAYPYLVRSTEIFPGVNNLTSLGVFYAKLGQYDKAEETLSNAMKYDDLYLTYENYALLQFVKKDYKKTISFTKNAVLKFPNSSKLWLYFALSAYYEGNTEDALFAATKAYEISPTKNKEYVINTIKNNQQIDLQHI